VQKYRRADVYGLNIPVNLGIGERLVEGSPDARVVVLRV
jgi:hypothetical protein